MDYHYSCGLVVAILDLRLPGGFSTIHMVRNDLEDGWHTLLATGKHVLKGSSYSAIMELGPKIHAICGLGSLNPQSLSN